MNWNAANYMHYETERNLACLDLLNAVTIPAPQRIIDLGCGPGNSTRLLHQHFPSSELYGLDNDHDMLNTAQHQLPDHHFINQSIEDWVSTQKFDLIFANASLHWLNNHKDLFPKLIKNLATSSASFACQMPDNLNEPAHQALELLKCSSKWQHVFSELLITRQDLLSINQYWELLTPFVKNLRIWHTTYYHEIPEGIKGVVSWFKSSALVPYLSILSSEQQQEFLNDYHQELKSAYSVNTFNTVLLPFPRLFIVANR